MEQPFLVTRQGLLLETPFEAFSIRDLWLRWQGLT